MVTPFFGHTHAYLLSYFPDERKAEIAATSRLFDETRELLEQMDLEVQDLPSDIKPKYSTRLQCYGQELARLAQEFVSSLFSLLFDFLSGMPT